MTTRTAEEAKCYYVEKMGEALGTQFDLLWQEVAWLHMKWGEYVELFGSKPTRVELLNQTAPVFLDNSGCALGGHVASHCAAYGQAGSG